MENDIYQMLSVVCFIVLIAFGRDHTTQKKRTDIRIDLLTEEVEALKEKVK